MEDNPLPFKWVKVGSPEREREREREREDIERNESRSMAVENIKKPTIFHDIGKGRIDLSFHEIQRRKEVVE